MKPVSLKNKILAALFFSVALIAPTDLSAGYPSFGINFLATGNGLAMAPAITAHYSFRSVDFGFGVNYQLRESRFTGYQGNICIYATPPARKVRLGFFLGGRYFMNASLKQNVVAQEKWKQPEAPVDYAQMRMRCVEGQAGFGLRIHHSYRISSFYGIGFGAYYTLGERATYAGMHRELSQAELTMNFGASYSLR